MTDMYELKVIDCRDYENNYTEIIQLMNIAKIITSNVKCPKRQVGCVLTDWAYKIVGMGCNGVPSSLPDCSKAHCYVKHNKCMAIHAEQNALMQCSDISDIHKVFVTTSPCFPCAKMLMGTGIKELYYSELYDIEVIDYMRTRIKVIEVHNFSLNDFFDKAVNWNKIRYSKDVFSYDKSLKLLQGEYEEALEALSDLKYLFTPENQAHLYKELFDVCFVAMGIMKSCGLTAMDIKNIFDVCCSSNDTKPIVDLAPGETVPKGPNFEAAENRIIKLLLAKL